jgi:hypothetical protein
MVPALLTTCTPSQNPVSRNWYCPLQALDMSTSNGLVHGSADVPLKEQVVSTFLSAMKKNLSILFWGPTTACGIK